MADYALPTLTSTYSDLVDLLKARDVSAMKLFDGTTDSNLPSGTKRWNSTNNNFEKFNGSTWAPLSTKYMINVDYVDGCTVNDSGTSLTDLWTASKVTSALLLKVNVSDFTGTNILDKLKLVDGAGSGLDADLLDGMNATSTNTASSVVARDASGNFSAGTITANLTGTASTASTASTATTLTGLTATVAELNFSDGVTSNIQTQLNGKLATTATAADSAKLNGVASNTTATADTIVKRDASGYIYGGAFNSTLADTATDATHYYVETGSDGWLRPKPLANVKAELLYSAALSGLPTAPTAETGTNSTQVATTAFVLANSDVVTSTTVGAATAGLVAYSIGSYTMLSRTNSNINNVNVVANTVYAGSAFGVSGTWRAMGDSVITSLYDTYIPDQGTTTYHTGTAIFIRIA